VRVSVAWATPAVQDVVQVELPPGATVGAAIAASGLLDRYGVARDSVRPGIRGRLVRDDTVAEDGDRIDLCRPLAVDPKEARRLRAAARSRSKAPPRDGGERAA
jgi:putative ubiquitin-RnfH superfamily antitoxin RatB of RatAB toxin-antitoxin module